MKIENIIEKVMSEAPTKVDVKSIAKELYGPDWDMKDRVWASGDILEIADTYWTDSKKHMQQFEDDWTSPTGSYAKYFKEEYGITFKIVKKQIWDWRDKPSKYKKLTGSGTSGVLVIFLKIDKQEVAESTLTQKDVNNFKSFRKGDTLENEEATFVILDMYTMPAHGARVYETYIEYKWKKKEDGKSGSHTSNVEVFLSTYFGFKR